MSLTQHEGTNETAPTLEPIEPQEAVQMYLQSRENELSKRSLELHQRHLTEFANWCGENGVANLNHVTARTVHEFRLEIGDGLASTTLSIHLSTIRQFLTFCESIDAVASGVAEKVLLPDRDPDPCTEMLEPEEAESLLGFLRQYRYGSRSHALMALLWHTGIRTGTARGLDVRDLETDSERLRIRHRPETGTPLKNGDTAERYIALSSEVTEAVGDYIEVNRHDVTDDHGREPLFTTPNGRPAKNSIRRIVYASTRPCETGQGCPHDRDPEECEAAKRTNAASKCPSSVSGHPVRRGSITHFLRKDVPEKVVSDRMNVSQEVLERHYDRRTSEEKTEQRRAYLDNV